MKYFHGGVPGKRFADLIQPPAVTGYRCASDYGAAHVHDRNKVYVTTNLEAAMMYAAMHPSGRGEVYEVKPIGELQADPDCSEPGLSFVCDRAKVVQHMKLAPYRAAMIRRAFLEL